MTPADLRSILEEYQDGVLARVTEALTTSQADRSGARDQQDSTNRRERRRRRRRARSDSSEDSRSSAADEGGEEAAGATPVPLPPVIQSPDDRFASVLDFKTYRLKNRRVTYGVAQARRMGRTTRNMKHSFGGYPPFSGKEPLKVFSWLRKLVKACDDNGISEGMAVYAVPHFLTGDAETRYTRVLPDAGSQPGGAALTSFPEVVNWFLTTYAEPHALALAQDRFSRATLELTESVEAFSVRLRGLSELCGNIHTEGTMKQQFIQGLPEYLRTDAYVYNTLVCTYQQLVTYAAEKYQAVRDVAKLAQAVGEVQMGSHGLRRHRTHSPPRPPTGPSPALVVAEEASKTTPEEPLAKGGPSRTPWASMGHAPRFLGGRIGDGRRNPRCYLCWEEGHMAYGCPLLSEGQREAVKRARDAFLSATNTSRASRDRQAYNKQVRVALVQSLSQGIDDSDDELDRVGPRGPAEDKPKPDQAAGEA